MSYSVNVSQKKCNCDTYGMKSNCCCDGLELRQGDGILSSEAMPKSINL